MLDHQRDLMADFRAIYHLSPAEAYELSGPEFLSLAWRVPAYSGVMAARLRDQDEALEGDRSDWGAPAGNTTRNLPLGASTAALVDADGGALGDLFD